MSHVDVNSPSKGWQCDVEMDGVYLEDDAQAEQFCTTRLPFPITKASASGPKLSCRFQINLFCKPDWYQIAGKCYKVLQSTVGYQDAKTMCSTQISREHEPMLAEYYSDSLGIWLRDLNVGVAWLTVPDMYKYYANGKGHEAGIYAWHGAFLYETGKGTIVMDDVTRRLSPLCQYTPAMTMAEMYYRASIYNKIYPITITSTGATLATSSYLTIDQKSETEYATDRTIRTACKAIGNILNVNSFPLASIEEEWEDVREGLTKHRFYLTSAYKNQGCKKKTYYDYDDKGMGVETYKSSTKDEDGYCEAHSFSFHKSYRLPTQAAMRAPALCTLHSYGFEYAPCPPGWVQFDREGKTRFCHFIELNDVVTREEAMRRCGEMNAALSGFETAEEFKLVRDLLKPPEPNKAECQAHFRLGGTSPCSNNCHKPEWKASWDQGVSRGTRFLNTYNGELYEENGRDYISFRADKNPEFGNRFHLHGFHMFVQQFFVCGRYADLITKKNNIKGVKNPNG